MKDDMTFDEWWTLVRKKLNNENTHCSFDIDKYMYEDDYNNGKTVEAMIAELKPSTEPEECSYCAEEMENDGLEYTLEATWTDGTWVCDHCNRPI